MWEEILILTLIIELSTILGRLIWGSKQKRFRENKQKFKVRIHHSYWGILLLLIYLFYQKDLVIILGVSLVISDAIHHFLVLPIWVRKTEFL